ncbi:MAG: class 1 isoprenoid biosynthesis enzyme [Chloroflexota bacterium]
MDIYRQITDSLLEIPCMDSWNEIADLFRRVASQKPRHWLLPLHACEAVGGDSGQALSAVLAIACFHLSIILVDDMLDSDPRGEYHRLDAPAAANMACALQAAGLEAVARTKAESALRFTALTCLNEMVLATTLGQYWDVQIPADEETYWRVVRTKSAPFFGAALQVGALMGGATPEAAERLKELGRLYGEMIQVHDDLNDALAVPANPDWLSGRKPLPILYAQSVPHPEREHFVELCKNITVPGALEQAQEILIRCGAVSYCVDVLLRQHEAARGILDSASLVRPEPMESLIEEVIAPVNRLFETMGS